MTPQYILRKSLCRLPHCFSAHVPGEGYVNRWDTKRVAQVKDELGLHESTPLSIVADRLCETEGREKEGYLLADYLRQYRERALSKIDNLEWANEYSEPGYTNPKKGILFANWNPFPSCIDGILERYGYDVQWSDEWATCSDCGNAVRTNPDGYYWTPYYDEKGIERGELVCLGCHKPEQEEQEEPEPETWDRPSYDDYTTNDYLNFYQGGKLVVTVDEGEEWEDKIREHMEQEQYWPNVYHVNERGTVDLLTV